MCKAVYIFAVILSLNVAFCQSDDLLENNQLKTTFEQDNNNLQESFLLNQYQKINLNNCSKDDLSNLGFLTLTQIQEIIQHREILGNYISIYELKTIESLDEETLEVLKELVFVPDYETEKIAQLLKNSISEENHYLVVKSERILETKKGYSQSASTSSKYLGGPYTHVIRYRLQNTNKIAIGLTAEKDAGEKFEWNYQKQKYGFDYVTGYVQLKNRKYYKNLILGNFSMNAGQGLVYANGLNISKSAETVLYVKRNQKGLMPYNSLLESGYFKGIGITFGTKNWELSTLASLRHTDSKLLTDSLKNDVFNESESFINSIYTTGYHRTAKEMATKNTLFQLDLGYNVRYNKNGFSVGQTTSYTHYLNPNNGHTVYIQPNKTVYNSNTFNGAKNGVSSLDFNYQHQNINFFGEIAQQHNNSRALILGNQTALGQKLDLAIVYRNYSPKFNSFYSNAFGEYFSNNDEQGVYMGTKFCPHKKWIFTGYYDVFKNKQLKYNQYSPSLGKEMLVSATFKYHKKIQFYFQYRQEHKFKNSDLNIENTYKTLETVRGIGLFTFKYDLEKNISFQTKLYHNTYKQIKTYQGVVLAQDISYKNTKYSISGRVATFDTDNYDTRIYLYERDVQYAFSFPSYYGKGLRYYINFQYNVTSNLKLWVRWMHIQYYDRNEMGSVGETIIGNKLNELKIQIKYNINK